jgi:hypothetical protein
LQEALKDAAAAAERAAAEALSKQQALQSELLAAETQVQMIVYITILLRMLIHSQVARLSAELRNAEMQLQSLQQQSVSDADTIRSLRTEVGLFQFVLLVL